MKCLTVGLTALVVLLGVGQTGTAAIQTENFDVDPGWTVVGSGDNGNDFGYQAASSYAGGSPGEGGGRFTRSDFVKYYGDTELGGLITLDLPFSASGKFDHTAAFTPDFGHTNMIGHFSTGGLGRVGIGLNNSGTSLYWVAVIVLDDFTTLGTGFTTIAPNVNRTWSYDWDPDGGTAGEGSLTVMLDAATHTLELTAAERATGATLDAFGFGGLAANGSESGWYADMYIDDVAYTVLIPEPSTLIIWLLLGAIGVGCGRWSRRVKRT